MAKYSDEFKIIDVIEYLKGTLGCKLLAIKFGIPFVLLRRTTQKQLVMEVTDGIAKFINLSQLNQHCI